MNSAAVSCCDGLFAALRTILLPPTWIATELNLPSCCTLKLVADEPKLRVAAPATGGALRCCGFELTERIELGLVICTARWGAATGCTAFTPALFAAGENTAASDTTALK